MFDNLDEKPVKLYILLGGSQHGKSSFIRYLDSSSNTKDCKIGNGLVSQTRQFDMYKIENKTIFNKENENILFLDTVGFGDS